MWNFMNDIKAKTSNLSKSVFVLRNPTKYQKFCLNSYEIFYFVPQNIRKFPKQFLVWSQSCFLFSFRFKRERRIDRKWIKVKTSPMTFKSLITQLIFKSSPALLRLTCTNSEKNKASPHLRFKSQAHFEMLHG